VRGEEVRGENYQENKKKQPGWTASFFV